MRTHTHTHTHTHKNTHIHAHVHCLEPKPHITVDLIEIMTILAHTACYDSEIKWEMCVFVFVCVCVCVCVCVIQNNPNWHSQKHMYTFLQYNGYILFVKEGFQIKHGVNRHQIIILLMELCLLNLNVLLRAVIPLWDSIMMKILFRYPILSLRLSLQTS